MAKKYEIKKSFKYQDKEGFVHLVKKGGVQELSKEALDVAKVVKKASGKPCIEEVD